MEVGAQARPRARGGAARRRERRRGCRGCPRPRRGTGSSAPAAGSARATSKAKNGLPSVASAIRRASSAGVPCNSSRIALGLNGPTGSRSKDRRSSARSTADVGPGGGRRGTRPRRRRAAAPRRPAPRPRPSPATGCRRSRPPPARARPRVAQPEADRVRLRRLVGRRAAQQRHLQRDPLRRGQRAQLEGRAQVDQRREGELGLGAARRATSTRRPAARAAAIPASHSVVLPIPGSPSSTSARPVKPADDPLELRALPTISRIAHVN